VKGGKIDKEGEKGIYLRGRCRRKSGREKRGKKGRKKAFRGKTRARGNFSENSLRAKWGK